MNETKTQHTPGNRMTKKMTVRLMGRELDTLMRAVNLLNIATRERGGKYYEGEVAFQRHLWCKLYDAAKKG